MSSPEVQFNLTIAEHGADNERLDDLTVQLMSDLKELDVESIERRVGKDTKKGAKGDPFTPFPSSTGLHCGLASRKTLWMAQENVRAVLPGGDLDGLVHPGIAHMGQDDRQAGKVHRDPVQVNGAAGLDVRGLQAGRALVEKDGDTQVLGRSIQGPRPSQLIGHEVLVPGM